MDQPGSRARIAGWRQQPGMLGLRYMFLHDPARRWLADGTIDWAAAVKLLKTAPPAENLPLTLELKEKAGPEALTTQQQLAAARKSLDQLEEEWE